MSKSISIGHFTVYNEIGHTFDRFWNTFVIKGCFFVEVSHALYQIKGVEPRSIHQYVRHRYIWVGLSTSVFPAVFPTRRPTGICAYFVNSSTEQLMHVVHINGLAAHSSSISPSCVNNGDTQINIHRTQIHRTGGIANGDV